VQTSHEINMKQIPVQLLFVFSLVTLINWKAVNNKWIVEKHMGYNILYTVIDNQHKNEYHKMIEKGISSVRSFFGSPYHKTFDIIIHPGRHSLDSSWQKDWNMPNFKSECWMVASGIATRLDMISPVVWDKEACEHSYTDIKKTQRLITHELVHVYHGQLNASPDFSNTEGIDWFVEGLATYASGQCDSTRIAEIKQAISGNKIPKGLDSFWTGNIKYGLSGSVVMYIDNKYGRIKLKALFPLAKKSAILLSLGTTEDKLLKGWMNYIQKL